MLAPGREAASSVLIPDPPIAARLPPRCGGGGQDEADDGTEKAWQAVTRPVSANSSGAIDERLGFCECLVVAAAGDMKDRQCPATKTGRTSGSVNHSLGPDSVRYMSVTTAAQRRLLTDDDTR